MMSSYLIAMALVIRTISVKKTTLTSAIAIIISGILGLPYLIFWWGHWWQVPVILLWFLSLRQALNDKIISAGLLVAVAVLLEPWGVLAIIPIMLLVHKRIKNRIVFLIISCSGGLGWLPFSMLKGFAMGKIRWNVEKSSIWGIGNLLSAGWPVRLLQAMILTVFVAIIVKIIQKQRKENSWIALIVVLSIVLLRLGLDSISFPYYWETVAFILIPATVLSLIEYKPFRIPLLIFTLLSIPFWIPWDKQINNLVEPFTFISALTIVPLLILVFSRSNNKKIDTINPPII